MLSRELLERELANQERTKAEASVPFTDRDKKLISAYRTHFRYRVIHKKKSHVMDDYTFTSLAKYLCESPTVSYESFKIISSLVSGNAKKYFTAKTFLMFPRDAGQYISSEQLVRFIERGMDVERTILTLMEIIPPGADPLLTYVTEQQLESYLLRMIPELDVFQDMHESFYEYYVYTCSQKFLFFLDPRKTNMIGIKRLAHSAVMAELLALRRLAINAADFDRNELDMQMSSNWFAESNAARLYSLFLDLDKDQNGMLNIDEISAFQGMSNSSSGGGGGGGGGDRVVGSQATHFTRTAWQRIFEESINYQQFELDYKGFVNLILAVESLEAGAPEAVRFFWRVLDFDQSQRLTPLKIRYFYRDVYDSLIGHYEAPDMEHVVVEVFDMLGCGDHERGATLEDLLRCKQGHTVISILLDINGFWRYDNRESLLANGGADEEEDYFHHHDHPDHYDQQFQQGQHDQQHDQQQHEQQFQGWQQHQEETQHPNQPNVDTDAVDVPSSGYKPNDVSNDYSEGFEEDEDED